MVQRVILLVLNPFSLAGGLIGLICGQTGLGVFSAVDQVRDRGGLVQGDGMAEVPNMH